MRNWWF